MISGRSETSRSSNGGKQCWPGHKCVAHRRICIYKQDGSALSNLYIIVNRRLLCEPRRGRGGSSEISPPLLRGSGLSKKPSIPYPFLRLSFCLQDSLLSPFLKLFAFILNKPCSSRLLTTELGYSRYCLSYKATNVHPVLWFRKANSFPGF